jgi:integrase/recombinase XerD
VTDALGQRTSVKQNGSAFADYYDTGNTSTPIFQGSRTGSATVLGRPYLEKCRPLLEVSASEPALFLTGYGGRLNPNYLGNWVRKTIDRAQLDKTGSCHLSPHACATHLLENGADLRMIQELLGHARLNTTQIYTAVTITQLRDVHACCHPRGAAKSAAPATSVDLPPGANPSTSGS